MKHKSRIILLLAIITALMATLIGCGSQIDLQREDWKMSTIQKESEYIAVSPSKAPHFPNVPAANMTINFGKYNLTIKNIDSGEEWKGTYKVKDSNQGDSAIYDVEFESGTKGLANSSITTNSDGDKLNTFVLSADNITIYFYAD